MKNNIRYYFILGMLTYRNKVSKSPVITEAYKKELITKIDSILAGLN